jgi:hypothetical protein
MVGPNDQQLTAFYVQCRYECAGLSWINRCDRVKARVIERRDETPCRSR